MRTTKSIAALAFSALAVSMNSAHADVSLSFNSLPSAQGWSYLPEGRTAAVPESRVFSTTGTSLVSNSIGLGVARVGSGNRYQLPGVVDPDLPFALFLRAEIRQEEIVPGTNTHFGFCFSVETPTAQFLFGLGADALGLNFEDSQPLPGGNSGVRDYLLLGDPIVGDYILLRSSDPIAAGTAIPSGLDAVLDWFTFDDVITPEIISEGVTPFLSGRPNFSGLNRLTFGDGTDLANANAEIHAFEFFQVPAPGSVGVLALAGAVATRRRR